VPLDEVAFKAPRRRILCGYHAAGAATGAFLIREGPNKCVYYAGMPAQLFDLAADPQEIRDLAKEPGYAGLVADCHEDLRGDRCWSSAASATRRCRVPRPCTTRVLALKLPTSRFPA
jgi:hypothetical protein